MDTRIIITLGLLLGTLLAPAPSQAQLRLLPQITQPLADRLRPITDPLRQRVDTLVAAPLRELGDELLERHPKELTRDPTGQVIVRGQLLALPSSDEARARALALPGVSLIETRTLDGLDLQVLLLRADADLLLRLRALDPDGRYDFQHLYFASGAIRPAATAQEPGSSGGSPEPQRRIGLIDSGIAADHATLQAARIETAGCPAAHPAAHGTAVASLLVGSRGALPGARLLAFDAYCDAADGGSALRVAEGLAWLARQQAGVVNISLVGPPNELLQRAVAAAQRRGLLLVAAVGNDGPAAPPLYPAAWPGVVAVTGVDPRRRVLAEAGRGPHVLFAAPGSALWGADVAGGTVELRGTSFAAPLVAALLARDPELEHLRAAAIDLGPPGRDDIYGWGLVGEALRLPRR
ncbi:S8 family serine peptidase [Pelomonas sp. KK5]|uniref:S8 family serine peptidase n=1 Tax=Pelomonas sp. KK5 TaxID=1855730 RepID=UPI0009F8897E|nr:S8 family serine peptidase [Pelomonas sp. KK5]